MLKPEPRIGDDARYESLPRSCVCGILSRGKRKDSNKLQRNIFSTVLSQHLNNETELQIDRSSVFLFVALHMPYSSTRLLNPCRNGGACLLNSPELPQKLLML